MHYRGFISGLFHWICCQYRSRTVSPKSTSHLRIKSALQHNFWHLLDVIPWLPVAVWSALAAPGGESARRAPQLPNCWLLLSAARAPGRISIWLFIVFFTCRVFVPTRTRYSLAERARWALGVLYVTCQWVQWKRRWPGYSITTTTCCLILCGRTRTIIFSRVALHCNALPHGLITTTLFHL